MIETNIRKTACPLQAGRKTNFLVFKVLFAAGVFCAPCHQVARKRLFFIYDFSNSYNLILSILIATIKYHLKT